MAGTRTKKAAQKTKNRLSDLEGLSDNGDAVKEPTKKAKAPSAPKKSKLINVEIPGLNIQMLTISIVGITGLIMNKWSNKAKTQMREKQTGKATAGRAPKNPEECFREAIYFHPDSTDKKPRYCFPGTAFKKAAVRAAKGLGLVMTDVRASFIVSDDMVEIVSPNPPVMREDMVRNSNKVADIRYRPEFKQWSADVNVQFNANMISAEQLINLFHHAGFSVGVGDWRNEKDGVHGAFRVAIGN